MNEEEYQNHCEEYNGYCKNCKDVTLFGSVEPDSRKRQCETCGLNCVYGMEESMLMGLIELQDDLL